MSQLERDLTAKRSGYLKALGDTRSALTSVRVTYEQSGAKDAKIDKALTNIDRGLTSLEKNVGPANAGKTGGKNLSAQQKRQLDAMRKKQTELQRKLQKVESKVSKNKAAISAIRDIQTRSARIYNSRNTAADFFAALMAARIIDGLLWGWHWWWGPWGGWIGPWCGGFVDIYYESIHVIDIDLTVIDAEIPIDDYVLDADLDQVALDAVDAELISSDFELSDAEIETIADEGIEAEPSDLDMETLPAPESPGEGEGLPEVDDIPEPEALPAPETLPEPELAPEMETLLSPKRYRRLNHFPSQSHSRSLSLSPNPCLWIMAVGSTAADSTMADSMEADSMGEGWTSMPVATSEVGTDPAGSVGTRGD